MKNKFKNIKSMVITEKEYSIYSVQHLTSKAFNTFLFVDHTRYL